MSTARSGIAFMIANVLALGVSWVATMFFTRELADPQVTLGQFAVFESIVSFAMLASMGGTGGAIIQRISGALNAARRRRFLGASLVVIAGRTTVVVTLMLATVPLYTGQFRQGSMIGVLAVALLVVLVVQRIATTTLNGLSLVGRGGLIGVVDALGRTASQGMLVWGGFGLVGLVGGAVVGTGTAMLIALVLVGGRIGVNRPTRDEIRSVIDYTKYNVSSGIATKFYDNIDIIIIKTLIGDAATGVYSIGFRFSLPIKIASGAVSQVMLPEVSKESSMENESNVAALISDGLVYATIIALPASVGVAVLARPLIVTFYTGAFADSALIAVGAVAIQIPDGFRSVLTTVLNAVNRPNLPARAGIILVGINAVLDLALVPTIGPFGAIVASFVGITGSTGYLGYHSFDALDMRPGDLPLREFTTEVFSAVLMGGVVLWLRETLLLPNIPLLAVTVPTGVVVYFGLLLSISTGIRQRILGIVGDVLPV